MSVVAISYSGLRNASSEATGVSRKLNSYANSLENSVYRKLNRYDGECPQNIREASNKVKDKVNMLRERADSYNQYATDLSELRTECQNTDKAVRGMVSNLTASFKETHGIKNNVVLNFINYHLTGAKNSSNLGRWINDRRTKDEQTLEYVKETIEDWWDYEGGKQLIKGVGVAALEIVAAVAGIIVAIGAIASAGTILALVAGIAGLVGGIIATVNGVTNLINESRAFASTQRGDPATGRKLSKQDKLSDTMRNEADKNVSFWHKVANGLDVVEFVCGIIEFVDGAKEFVTNFKDLSKNMYKWTKGSKVDISSLTMRDILTKDNFKDFVSKIGRTVKDGIVEIRVTIHDAITGNPAKLQQYSRQFGNDFLNNLKNYYQKEFDFGDIESIGDSIETITDFGKDLLEADDLSSALRVATTTIVAPNLPITKVETKIGNSIKVTNIPVGDFLDISDYAIGDTIDLVKDAIDLEKNLFPDVILEKDIRKKLSTNCNISISIPNVSIPNINVFNNNKISFAM